jgi:hypothetical protein
MPDAGVGINALCTNSGVVSGSGFSLSVSKIRVEQVTVHLGSQVRIVTRPALAVSGWAAHSAR